MTVGALSELTTTASTRRFSESLRETKRAGGGASVPSRRGPSDNGLSGIGPNRVICAETNHPPHQTGASRPVASYIALLYPFASAGVNSDHGERFGPGIQTNETW